MVRRKSTTVRKKTNYIVEKEKEAPSAEEAYKERSHKRAHGLKSRDHNTRDHETGDLKKMVDQKSRKVKHLQSDMDDNMSCDDEMKRSEKEITDRLPKGSKKIEQKRSVIALREIRQYQRSAEFLIPRVSFGRLCREIFIEYAGPEIGVQHEALECLQESAEMYLVQLFEDAYLCSMHERRVTLMTRDVRLARRIGGKNGYYL